MTTVRRRAHLKMGDDSQRTAAALLKQGLDLPDPPEHPDFAGIPRLQDIDDLTALDDQDLMSTLAMMTAWAGYLGTQLALAMIDERCAEEAVSMAEATSMVRDWGGASKDRVTVAKAQRQTDPDVQKRKQDLLDTYSYRKLIEVMFNNVDREAAIVSRELTRRTSGADPKTRRTGRFTP